MWYHSSRSNTSTPLLLAVSILGIWQPMFLWHWCRNTGHIVSWSGELFLLAVVAIRMMVMALMLLEMPSLALRAKWWHAVSREGPPNID
jgi:hypothetical protein